MREETEEHRYAEELDVAVMLSSNSAWPNTDGDTDSSQDTQNTTIKIGTYSPHGCGGLVANESNNSKFDEFMCTRMESVYPEQTDSCDTASDSSLAAG